MWVIRAVLPGASHFRSISNSGQVATLPDRRDVPQEEVNSQSHYDGLAGNNPIAEGGRHEPAPRAALAHRSRQYLESRGGAWPAFRVSVSQVSYKPRNAWIDFPWSSRQSLPVPGRPLGSSAK
jgi:hypothetical protein